MVFLKNVQMKTLYNVNLFRKLNIALGNRLFEDAVIFIVRT